MAAVTTPWSGHSPKRWPLGCPGTSATVRRDITISSPQRLNLLPQLIALHCYAPPHLPIARSAIAFGLCSQLSKLLFQFVNLHFRRPAHRTTFIPKSLTMILKLYPVDVVDHHNAAAPRGRKVFAAAAGSGAAPAILRDLERSSLLCGRSRYATAEAACSTSGKRPRWTVFLGSR
jgi:hypothetical protein